MNKPLQSIPLLVLLLQSQFVFGADWQTAPSMPTPRQEIYVATHGNNILVPGGVLADGIAYTATFEKYDTQTKTWHVLAPLPQARHHITPAVVSGTLYAVGGFSGGYPNWLMHDDVYEYDLENNNWKQGVSLPGPLAEHVYAVVNNRIHIIGGRKPGKQDAKLFDDYVDTDVHLIYDPDKRSWSNGKPAPTARNSAAAAVYNNLIYVVGGRVNIVRADGTQIQTNLDTLEAYDSVTDSWTTLAPMPIASGGLAAAALDDKIYVFGGEQWTSEQKVFADSWVYDISSNSWSRLPDLPTARHGLAATAVDDTIYVIGGGKLVGGGAASGVMETLTP